MKLFKGKSMKILIIVSFIMQFTLLSADINYVQYTHMKEEAYSLYENYKTEESLTVVKDFISRHPKSIRAENLLAVLYYWNGNLSKSKEVLYSILSKKEFPQAAALLKKIERKDGKRSNSSQKVSKKIIQKTSISNLMHLVNKIKKDPHDALSRKILALHYEKIGNTKQSNYFANAVLKINPDDEEMLSLLKSKNLSVYTTKDTANKALKKLEYFNDRKEYNRFMNLYISLENNNIVIPTQIHVNALYCAIELEQYEKAKSILHIYRMPKNRYISQIEKLLDEKLLLRRFVKDCSSGFCDTSR